MSSTHVNTFIRFNEIHGPGQLSQYSDQTMGRTKEEGRMDSLQLREADHSPSCTADIKNKWSLQPHLHTSSQISV